MAKAVRALSSISWLTLALPDLTTITAHRSRENHYAAIPELPESSFDLSLVLADSVTWGMLQEIVGKADPLIASLDYIGEYRPSGLSEGQRSLTLRLTLQPSDATLTRDDIAAVRTNVLALLEREFACRPPLAVRGHRSIFSVCTDIDGCSATRYAPAAAVGDRTALAGFGKERADGSGI